MGRSDLPTKSLPMIIPKQLVYIETSVVSYLMARPSRDLLTAARQAWNREWWEIAPIHWEMAISELVPRRTLGDHQMNRDNQTRPTESLVRAPDPILAELWEVKRQINQESGYCIHELVRMAHDATLRIQQQWDSEACK